MRAIQDQAAVLDFAPAFQLGHDGAFTLASRLAALALKIALAYRHAEGEGRRTRLIGRERGNHGVGFGGISVGGISTNRRASGLGLPGVDHLPHTCDRSHQAFTKGEPEWGAHLAAVIALAPPLIVSDGEIVEKLGAVIRAVA